MKQTFFLTGIDTDAGKTYATAFMARRMMDRGLRVITQKFIQTGCKDFSEDIEAHRRLLGMPLQPEDLDHTTAPIIFTYPASAQLAARLDKRDIDLSLIDRATARLLENHDVVIVEGAGGLMVPVTDDFFAIDYAASRHIPVILTTNGVLGSINHTILSLKAIASRSLELPYVIYNKHFDTDGVIAADTLAFIRRYLAKHFPTTELIEMPSYESLL